MRPNLRNRALLIGFVVMLYLSYHFAISKTINCYDDYKANDNILKSNGNTPGKTLLLLQNEAQLDKLLSQFKISDSQYFQNDLLKEINGYCLKYHLKVIDFKEPHIIARDNRVTTSYIFSVQGSYNGSLAMLNKIENNPALGIIGHVSFIKKKNYKTNQDELFIEFILSKTREV